MGTPVNKLKVSSENLSEDFKDTEGLFEKTMKEIGQDASENCDENGSLASSDSSSTNNQALINNTLKQNGDILSSIEANEQAEKMVEQILIQKSKKTTIQKVIDDLREPILVAILFIIFNTGFFSNLLTKYLPRVLANAGGNLNYSGILVHSLLFGLVFYTLRNLLS